MIFNLLLKCQSIDAQWRTWDDDGDDCVDDSGDYDYVGDGDDYDYVDDGGDYDDVDCIFSFSTFQWSVDQLMHRQRT